MGKVSSKTIGVQDLKDTLNHKRMRSLIHKSLPWFSLRLILSPMLLLSTEPINAEFLSSLEMEEDLFLTEKGRLESMNKLLMMRLRKQDRTWLWLMLKMSWHLQDFFKEDTMILRLKFFHKENQTIGEIQQSGRC